MEMRQVVKKLLLLNFLDVIWTWTSHFKKLWTMVGLAMSFENSGRDLGRKI